MNSRTRAVALLVSVILFAGACNSSPTDEPTGIADQIYISQISNTTLQVLSPEKIVDQPSNGDLIDFRSGETFTTTETGAGYVQLGFPGQVKVYLASGSEIVIQEPDNEQTRVQILVNSGLLIAELPHGQRVVIQSPDGARVWANGSMIGVDYGAATHETYAECLKATCGYEEGATSKSLPAGSFVSFAGAQITSSGSSRRADLWQFVPGMITPPTPIPSATPNLAATQSCRYFMSLDLPCDGGFPTATITPSATPNFEATQACRRNQNLGTPCP